MLEETIRYEKTGHSHFCMFSARHGPRLLRVERSRDDYDT